MRTVLVGLALLLCFPLCATEPAKTAKKVVCHIRGLEGDPAGSIEKGTVKALWEPHVATVEGREAVFGAGGDNEVPGTMETLYGGIWVEIKPTKIDKGIVTARIALEMTRLDDTDRETFVSSSGKVVRAVGKFACGKPIKIVGQEKINGTQFWIEVTFQELASAAPVSETKESPVIRPVSLPKKKAAP